MQRLRREPYRVFFHESDPLPKAFIDRVRKGMPGWTPAPPTAPPGHIQFALVEVTNETKQPDGKTRANLTTVWESTWFEADRRALVAASNKVPTLIPGSMEGRAVWYYNGSAWTTVESLTPDDVLALIRDE